MIWKSLLSLGFLGHVYASTAASPLPTVTTDVVVIGGGSAGTYTAIRLQQLGKSVFVIEKEDVLGGHTNTFHVPGTNTTMGVALRLFDVGVGGTTEYAKLNGGDATATTTVPSSVSWSNATNVGLALEGYLAQSAKYALFLTNGYDLPDPVPEELLMPWGAFARKHGIETFDYTLFSRAQGAGNMLAQPALYVLKYFVLLDVQILAGIQPGFLTTAAHNTHALTVALSSNVTRIARSASSVSVSVSTPGGAKTVHAKELVNRHPADAAQPHFNNSYYWEMVIAGTEIPDNLFINAPGLYGVGSAGVDGLAVAYFGSPHYMSDVQVKAERWQHWAAWCARMGGTTGHSRPSLGFHNHAPFLLTVDVEAVRKGFYRRLNTLQGAKNTWWTGAAWQTG
ncbi:flavin-containing superfamily amine oxidase [Mycena rebaudengoi]|nr:flavin-containing superfamily amine oxidase [Mycena rebaudengoi]